MTDDSLHPLDPRRKTNNAMATIDLSKLALPFPAEDIEWRVTRSGRGGKRGIYAMVVAYITARGIQYRLDDVCTPSRWRLEPPQVINFGKDKTSFGAGISILLETPSGGFEWVTKWDVSEPTNIEAAKGGFSGAMKRAGAQWGIGRYLYHLEETFAETTEDDPAVRGWHYAKLPEKQGGDAYYWKEPQLPAWALPKEAESEISVKDLDALKREWRMKFAPEVKNRADLVEGFNRFVVAIMGEFPVADHTCWTHEALAKCRARIQQTTEPNGPSADVPFA